MLLLLCGVYKDLVDSYTASLLLLCQLTSFLFVIFLQYIAMYSDIGQKSNTMIFSDRPADVNALLAQASTVVGALSSANKK